MARRLLTLTIIICTVLSALAQTMRTLNKDVVLKTSMHFSGNTTLDLNGFTISACVPEAVIVVDSNSTLTIIDSQETGCIKHYETKANDETSQTYQSTGILVSSTGTLDFLSGTIEVTTNEGTATEPEYSVYKNKVHGIYVEEGGTCYIEGGTIKTSSLKNSYGIYSLGTVNITDGVIDTYAKRYAYGCTNAKSGASLIIDGGTISTSTQLDNPDEENDFCASIYANAGNVTINNITLSSKGAFNTYGLYATSSAKAVVNDGKFFTKASLNSNYEIYGGASNITLNGGIYAHEYFLKKYANTKNVNNLLPSDARYKEGYCYGISDKEDDNSIIALNLTDNSTYTNLIEAINSAEKGDTIVLHNDYTLTQDLVIPSGVTLLIPFDNRNTRFTQNIEGMFPCPFTPTPYRTLTIAEGMTLTANGSICVAACLFGNGGAVKIGCGSVQGNYGNICLKKDANIIVNDTLYCWGYIHGEGTVTMNKGSKLCEVFNILDWRGGDRTTKIYTKMYPLEQYQIQNVESKLIVKPGANTYASSCIEVQDWVFTTLPFHWIGNKNAFFTTSNYTTVIRTYDSTTDRMTYNFDESVTLGTMQLGFVEYGYDMYVDSKNSRAHLMDNWTLNIQEGTLTVPYKYNMLPGCKINIAPEANMVIAEDASINLFDKNQWGEYCPQGFINPIYYTIANGTNTRIIRCGTVTGQRSQTALDNMTSASIDVQGQITVKGSLTATEGGANIISTGLGVIDLANATDEEGDSIFMVKELEYTWDGFVSYPAPLRNADGTSADTKNCQAGTSFTYINGVWQRKDPTAINDIMADNDNTIANSALPCYDLMGRRVSTMMHGRTYIRGGKTFIYK